MTCEHDDVHPCFLGDEDQEDASCCDGYDDERYDGSSDEPCDECVMYGEFQCSLHADGYLLACAEEDRRQRVIEALSVISDLGRGYGGVVGEMAAMAREAERELGAA